MTVPAPEERATTARGDAKHRAFHDEAVLGAAHDLRLLRRLYPFVRPHLRFLGLSFAALAGVTGLALATPIVMGSIVHHASSKDTAGLFRDGLALLAIVLFSQALSFVQMYTMQITGARAMSDLRATIFSFLQRLQLQFFDRTPVGRLVTRTINDVDSVGELFAAGGLNAIGDFGLLVGIVAMMLLLDVRMSCIAFAALPLVGIIVFAVRRRSREAFRDIRTKTARLNTFLNEQVSGINVVQAFGRERATAAEFDEINDAYREASKRSIYYEAVMEAVIELLGTVCIASILWWAGLKHMPMGAGLVEPLGIGPPGGAASFPLLVTFTQYIKQFFQPISMLSQRYTLLQSSMAGAERIFQLLGETKWEESDVPVADSAPSGPEDEAILFSGVCFQYQPGTPVLKDVSFTVKRGERVALVGATGAGKTTVASLVLRLYEPASGFVRVFGKDVCAYAPRDLRERFSVVPQDVHLFAGTLLSNITMGEDSGDPRARTEEALRSIGAHELFMGRDEGLDARIDERGANFSAGERQLIAFARAIYRDAPALILDEATASVDSDTEARLEVGLGAVMKNRTSLIIAHRLSTIRAVDRILVFHKGCIVESGSHDELVALDGMYARLHRMQRVQQREGERSA